MEPSKHRRPRTWIERWWRTAPWQRPAGSVTRGAPTRQCRAERPAPSARRSSTPILAALGGLALVACLAFAVIASGSTQPRSSAPVALATGTASETSGADLTPTPAAAALPTLAPATPNGPQPTIVAVNRRFTDKYGTVVILTQMERLESGKIRLTFDLQFEGKPYKGKPSVPWWVNDTEYLKLSSGAIVHPSKWGVGSTEYRVGNDDHITVGRTKVTTWELYPALSDPHPTFTCHTDLREFDDLTL